MTDGDGVSDQAAGGPLRLRPLRAGDEPAFWAAHRLMAAEDFPFGLDLEPTLAWPEYLKRLDQVRCGIALREGRVPATFLVADVAGEITGRASIRHRLNEHLEREGGHIGYAVLPRYRRRGYATEILRQSLIITRAAGVDRVLVTCDDNNPGSIAVIEANGGRLDGKVAATGGEGHLIRRYWID
jgi:predicted acetyltransferase